MSYKLEVAFRPTNRDEWTQSKDTPLSGLTKAEAIVNAMIYIMENLSTDYETTLRITVDDE